MQIMKKAEAINKVNSLIHKKILNNMNSAFANINKAKPVWWINIDPDKLNFDLFILLVSSSKLYILHIPPNKIQNPTAKFRLKGKALDIEIGSNPGMEFFRDVKSGGTMFNFKPYLLDEVEL